MGSGRFSYGGINTLSICEVFFDVSSLIYRNLLSIETEELIARHPFDGVVLIGGCDKNVPAQLMAVASVNKPTISPADGSTDVKIDSSITVNCDETVVAVSSFTTISGTPKSPVISPSENSISLDTPISITCATEGASIYYTINGDNPAVDGILYTEPFTVPKQPKVKIRAIAVSNGFLGKESSIEYIMQIVCKNNTGEYYEDNLCDVITVSDGIVAVGKCVYDNGGRILKCNYDNKKVWDKVYDVYYDNDYCGITEVSDGIIVVGNTDQSDGREDGIIAKYGYDGKYKWVKNFGFGNRSFERLYDVTIHFGRFFVRQSRFDKR